MKKENMFTNLMRQSLFGAVLFSAGIVQAASASGMPEASDAGVGSVNILQQKGKTVSGVITDAYGAVIGANVVVKGTTTGTVTDVDGKFTLANVAYRCRAADFLYRIRDTGNQGR